MAQLIVTFSIEGDPTTVRHLKRDVENGNTTLREIVSDLTPEELEEVSYEITS